MVLRRFLLLIFPIAMAVPAAAACNGPSLRDRLTETELEQLDAIVAEAPYSDGLFWVARKDGVRLVIAGTLHVPDPRLEPMVKHLQEIVAGVDLVMLESTASEQAQVQAALQANPGMMFITDGPTLPDRLSEDDWEALAQAARARGLPPLLVAKFQPWYLLLSLALPACALPEMTAGGRGLDHRIAELAGAAEVPVRALEDWDTIFELMGERSEEEQLEMLRISVMVPELQEEMFVAMLESYFAQRVAEVRELSRLSARHVPGVDLDAALRLMDRNNEVLLDRRNLIWISSIEAAASGNDDILIAAGAAHLPGTSGILALLASRGWEVSPLRRHERSRSVVDDN